MAIDMSLLTHTFMCTFYLPLRCIECASQQPIDGVRMHITNVRAVSRVQTHFALTHNKRLNSFLNKRWNVEMKQIRITQLFYDYKRSNCLKWKTSARFVYFCFNGGFLWTTIQFKYMLYTDIFCAQYRAIAQEIDIFKVVA